MAISLPAADVGLAVVLKGLDYDQTAPGTVTAQTGNRFAQFECFVTLTAPNSVTAATVQPMGGAMRTLVLDADGEERAFSQEFSSQALMDLSFPNAIYTVNMTTANDGARSLALLLTGNAYPNTPQVINFTAAQNIDPSQNFTLSWNAFAGGTADDIILLEIEDDATGDGVFSTPPPGSPNALNGTATSVTIPSGTFVAGRSYSAWLTFVKVVAADPVTYPGALGAAVYVKTTELPMAARQGSGEADAAFIVVLKGFDYDQADADTVVPAGGASFAEFSAFVMLTASNSITTATVQTPLSNITLALDADGEERSFDADFESQAALDAAYPNGAHTFNLVGVNDGPRTITLNLTGDVYPNTPRLSNYGPAQTIAPGQDFTFSWDPFVGGTTNDMIMVEIWDPIAADDVFATPPPGIPGSLDGTATSVVVPANTLQPNRQYYGHISFNRFVHVDDTSYPGAFGVAVYYKDTEFTITTAGFVPDTTPPYLMDVYRMALR